MMARTGQDIPKYLSQDELRKLLEQADPNTMTGLRDRTMMEVMAYAGLRVGELVALERSNITWRGDHGLPVIHVIDGKGLKDRNVTVREKTGQWLRTWDRKRYSYATKFFHTCAGRSGGAVTSTKHSGISTRTVQDRVKRYAQAAGLPDWISPHNLRHTCAIWMLTVVGEPTTVVQTMLGHERLETTEIYAKCSDTHQAQAMQRASRMEADQQSLDTAANSQDAALLAVIAEVAEQQGKNPAELVRSMAMMAARMG